MKSCNQHCFRQTCSSQFHYSTTPSHTTKNMRSFSVCFSLPQTSSPKNFHSQICGSLQHPRNSGGREGGCNTMLYICGWKYCCQEHDIRTGLSRNCGVIFHATWCSEVHLWKVVCPFYISAGAVHIVQLAKESV